MTLSYLSSLKAAREQSGFTQKDVEKSLNMRSLMMRDYEVGRLKLPVSVAIDLAKLYEVTLDALVGEVDSKAQKSSKALTNLSSLFLGRGFSEIFQDPVLKAYLEDFSSHEFDDSLFEILMESVSYKDKKSMVLVITKTLFALASCDGQISEAELEWIRYFLSKFDLKKKYQEISKVTSLDDINLGHTFKRIEMRHFMIWILFFFAKADGRICHKEINFINSFAQKILMNRSNFIFIKNKFIKEEF